MLSQLGGDFSKQEFGEEGEEEKRLNNAFALTTRATQTKNNFSKVMKLSQFEDIIPNTQINYQIMFPSAVYI